MNSAETKIERQVQLWALTGPMMALLSSSLILFKGPSHSAYLVVGLLIGLPACWWAKWRGLAGSLGVLAALFVFNYSGIPAGQKLWHLGMAASIVMCFIVTWLSLEEAQSVLEKPEMDQEQQNKLLEMQKVHEEQLIELNNYKELLEVARQEVVSNKKELENLKQDSVQKTQNYAQLEEKYAEVNSRLTSQNENFAKSRQEMQYFQERLQSMHGELQSAKMDTQTAKSELAGSRRQVEELLQEVSKAREVSDVYAKAHEDQLVREAQTHDMADHIATLTKEKELLETAVQNSREQHQKTLADFNQLQDSIGMLQLEKEQAVQELEVFKKEFKDVQARALRSQEESARLQAEKITLESNLTKTQEVLKEKEALQTRLSALQAELENVRKQRSTEYAELNTQLTNLRNKADALTAEKEALHSQRNTLQSELETIRKQSSSEQHALHAQLTQLQNRAEALSAEKETLNVQLSHLQTELENIREQHKQRSTEYAELNTQLTNLQNKADSLSVEKERSLQELQALRAERDSIARDIQANGHSFEGFSSEAAAWRQAEAKYTQLQGQFADKSAVLDATRRELFVTQEKLLQLQKEMEESQTYTINEAEAALTQQLIQLDTQAKSELADYQKEVAALHEIITALMRNK